MVLGELLVHVAVRDMYISSNIILFISHIDLWLANVQRLRPVSGALFLYRWISPMKVQGICNPLHNPSPDVDLDLMVKI